MTAHREGPRHVVAIVGGAVSGSVAAEILADRGCEVIVFDQNDRPYGKIEDGLPRWHTKQRRAEYGKIDARLTKPGVHFVPRTKLGRDIDFLDLAKSWGLSAFLLANGAWRDRTVEAEGADQFIDKGLVYQNPFIYWFNHANEKTYSGQRYEVPDGTIVLGGGLASIDVIKVVQIELYRQALKKRGIDADMYHLEEKGIPETCKAHGVDPASLGLKGGLLVYRRRPEDMPLADDPPNATPEQKKKTEAARKKILEKCQKKFLFRFEPQRITQGLIVEGGRLAGLKLAETKVEGRKVDVVPGTTKDYRTGLVISSIGSVPEKLPGVNMKGEYYTFKSWDTGEYDGIDGVYALGNVVTGKGNIHDSFLHGQSVAKYVAESYLGLADGGDRDLSAGLAAAADRGAAAANAIAERVKGKTPLPPERVSAIFDRIATRQRAVGYAGDYKAWLSKVTPTDLE